MGTSLQSRMNEFSEKLQTFAIGIFAFICFWHQDWANDLC
jgi:hypothetical protein